MILLSRLVCLEFGWSRNMFYAVFLTKLPMPLRELINTYLGDRTKILIKEAVIFHLLLNQLYREVFEVTDELYFYASLPTHKFRTYLLDLHDLRLEFANCLRPLGIRVFSHHSWCNDDMGNRNYSGFLSRHDWLFSRAVSIIVIVINFLRQFHHPGVRTKAVCQEIEQLNAANCRWIIDQLALP